MRTMPVYYILLFLLSLQTRSATSASLDDLNSGVSEGEVMLEASSGLRLAWQAADRRLRVRATWARDAPDARWLAVGFSPRGELPGADLCLVWLDYRGKTHYEDTHVDESGRVERDNHQNCEHFHLDGNARTLYFERDFDTCDEDDYVIEEGTTHIVWARGPDTLFTARGLCVSCARAHGLVRVGLLRARPLPRPHARELLVTARSVRVPSEHTTYWCRVMKLPDDVTRRVHHVVHYEVVVTPGNEDLVHHMEVFYCDTPSSVPLYEGSCTAAERPPASRACTRVRAAWAMGAPPFTYPEEAGLPLGGPQANPYVMLEIHYNNPELIAGRIDSSGMKMLVTPTLRPHDAAIMELGLEYIDKMAIPPGETAFPLSGHCIPQCTAVGLPPGGILIFASQLHTHLTGVTARTQHYRNGRELPPLSQDPHYSTHFQEIRALPHPVRVLPGDGLVTTCEYDTTSRSNVTLGGFAITDEMCVNYLHYYPAAPLEVCKSSVGTRALRAYFQYERDYDGMDIPENVSATEQYSKIEPWNRLRKDTLKLLYAESPISMQCNRSDGSRFEGEWDGIPLPRYPIPLPPKPRDCPNLVSG